MFVPGIFIVLWPFVNVVCVKMSGI